MEESKEGSKGKINPYNSIIYGLLKQNRFDDTGEFLKKTGNLFPRAVNRSLMILEHYKKGSIEDAERPIAGIALGPEGRVIFMEIGAARAMAGDGFNGVADVDNFLYGIPPNSMISGYVRNKRLMEALELFRKMQRRRVQPSEFTPHKVELEDDSSLLVASYQPLPATFTKSWIACVDCGVENNQEQDGMEILHVIDNNEANGRLREVAEQHKEKLLLVMNGVVNIEKQLAEYERDSKQTKTDDLETFVGSSIPKEVGILPPQFSKTKGSGKRIKSGKEKPHHTRIREHHVKVAYNTLINS
ncbi:hypothetical protein JHK85_056546 [Glycine max]|nr:hypothetical protein JHK86_055536 [Glycine max]KAG4918265.1 hypothetical protein JHK85_056546 [Glycine max]